MSSINSFKHEWLENYLIGGVIVYFLLEEIDGLNFYADPIASIHKNLLQSLQQKN